MVAGALVAIGLVNCGVQNENDPGKCWPGQHPPDVCLDSPHEHRELLEVVTCVVCPNENKYTLVVGTCVVHLHENRKILVVNTWVVSSGCEPYTPF